MNNISSIAQMCKNKVKTLILNHIILTFINTNCNILNYQHIGASPKATIYKLKKRGVVFVLVNSKEMLFKARKEGYGVAQPNVWDLHSLRAVIQGCEEKRSPVIVALAEVHFDYIDPYEIMNMARFYMEKADIPIAMHLDHGNTFEACVNAIRAGFTSVMLDASMLSFEENVKRTAEIVKIAHKCGVTVEAELGHVGQGEDYEKIDKDLKDLFTNPEQAQEFVDLTGVDSLAVAIGTAHGEYKGTPKIDLTRLKEIRNMVNVPLVLHGGSGTGDNTLKKCIDMGISKINICTDLMKAGAAAVNSVLNEKNYIDLGMAGEEGIKKCLQRYIDVFGCVGKA